MRDRLPAGKVTAISVSGQGAAGAFGAGQIARLWGLNDVRIGDPIGDAPAANGHHFAPPTLETIVEPRDAGDRGALHVALTQLAEQDPLINLRSDAVSLYGEVQKEVIEATLAEDYGIAVSFRETTTICIERPAGSGAAVELIGTDANPLLATVGLRVDPAPFGAGVAFGLEVELGSMPFSFFKAVEETVYEALAHGVHGWQVTDCAVTMTHSGYYARQSHAHGTFDKSMSSTARDFRALTPIVLRRALERAGTTVYEPLHRFRIEAPADTFTSLLPALAKLGAVPHALTGDALDGEIPAARVRALELGLPALTHGEGVLECAFARYEAAARSATSPCR